MKKTLIILCCLAMVGFMSFGCKKKQAGPTPPASPTSKQVGKAAESATKTAQKAAQDASKATQKAAEQASKKVEGLNK